MKLDEQHIRQIYDALLSGYPTHSDLARLVRFGLNENLEAIAQPSNLQDTCLELVKWSEARGSIHKLIESACKENPGNEQLQRLSRDFELRAVQLQKLSIRVNTNWPAVPHYVGILVVLGIAVSAIFVWCRYSLYSDTVWPYIASLGFIFIAAPLIWYLQNKWLLTKLKIPFIGFIVALLSVLGTLSYQQVILARAPKSIDPEKFGIVIATLQNRSGFSISRRGHEIADAVYTSLGFAIGSEEDLDTKDFEIRRVWAINSPEEAKELGKELSADLVIWGGLFEQAQNTTIYFQLIETDLLTANPDFPRTIPVHRGIDLSIGFQTTESQSITDVVKPQILGLTFISLGLYYYHSGLDPDNAWKWFATAESKFKEASPSQDLPMKRLKTIRSNSALVNYYLGKSLQLQGQYENAQVFLIKAAQMAPSNQAAWLGLMYNFRSMGDNVSMEKVANCVAKSVRGLDSIPSYSDFCKEMLSVGQESVTSPVQHIERDDSVYLYNRGLAFEALEQFESALEQYERAINKRYTDKSSNFFIGYLKSAEMLTELGRYDDARDYYIQIESLSQNRDTRRISYFLSLAAWYKAQDEWDGALLSYNQAIKLNSELAVPYLYRAEVYHRLGLVKNARLDYEQYISKSVDVNNSPGVIYYRFAEFLRQTGSNYQALESYQDALDNSIFDSSLVYARRGQVYTELRLNQEAIQEFEDAIQNPPLSAPFIHELYGYSLYQMGSIDRAIQQYEQVIELMGENPTLGPMLNLAKLYSQTEESSRGVQLLATILEDSNIQISNEDRFRIQQCLEELEDMRTPALVPVDLVES
ncbi:MAG: effector-associated domain EAD1-containing protein [Chloroflexota bacterium]